MLKSIVSAILNIRGDFQNLFFFNEFNELEGKSKKGILGLTVILTLTFIALGFSIGGIQNLDKKMNDPFTNWVNLPISMDKRDSINNIRRDFEALNVGLKDSFQLENIGDYRVEYYNFIHFESKEIVQRRIRTIYPDENLLSKILLENNVISGYSLADDTQTLEYPDQCGLVIKEEALSKLGYDDHTKILKLPLVYQDNIENLIIYLPLISVVKELPNMADALVTSKFNFLFNDPSNKLMEKVEGNQLRFYSQDLDKEVLENSVRGVLTNEALVDIDFDSESVFKGEEMTEMIIYFRDNYEYKIMDSIFKEIQKSISGITKNLDWVCYGESRLQTPHYFSFNFIDLENIRSFKDFLSERYKVDISMNQVESKENFSMVSKLTSFLATILFAFSLLSIIFYINSMLRTHLEKIKMNLGTLKAFGLNNKFLVNSYIKIIVTFILMAILFGLILCGLYTLIEPIFTDDKYFNIFHIRILFAIVIIVLVSIFTTRLTISKTLMKTPGDLIYNR